MSPVKEPSFFCDGFRVVNSAVDYFTLFDGVGAEKRIGEASHVYLTNPSTAGVLKALFPTARFVVILRNPADRAYSLYHHMRRKGYEWAGSFEKALELEEKRWRSERFRRTCPQYFYNFLYFRSGLYGQQIERYFSLFDKTQFHVLTLDELKSDPVGSLRGVLELLEVDPDFSPTLRVHNEGARTALVPQLQYFFRSKVTRPRLLKRLGWSIVRRVNRMKIPPIRAETREALLRRYASDLERLAELTGIRFPQRGLPLSEGHWRSVKLEMTGWVPLASRQCSPGSTVKMSVAPAKTALADHHAQPDLLRRSLCHFLGGIVGRLLPRQTDHC